MAPADVGFPTQASNHRNRILFCIKLRNCPFLYAIRMRRRFTLGRNGVRSGAPPSEQNEMPPKKHTNSSNLEPPEGKLRKVSGEAQFRRLASNFHVFGRAQS